MYILPPSVNKRERTEKSRENAGYEWREVREQIFCNKLSFVGWTVTLQTYREGEKLYPIVQDYSLYLSQCGVKSDKI